MDHEAVWVLRDLVEETLRAAYRRHGTTPRDEGAHVDIDAGRHVTLRRHAVGHETKRAAPTEGPRISSRVPLSHRAATRKTIRFVDLHMALKARWRHVEGRWAEDGVIPAWTLLAHPLVAHLVHVQGRSPVLTARPRRVEGGMMASNQGIVLEPPDGQDGPEATRTDGLRLLGGWTNGGIATYAFRIRSRDGRCVMAGADMPPILSIPGTTLPDALLAGVAGRPLDSLISHPLLKTCNARVASATNVHGGFGEDDSLRLKLRRELVPLDQPPAGTDVSWLRIIAEGSVSV